MTSVALNLQHIPQKCRLQSFWSPLATLRREGDCEIHHCHSPSHRLGTKNLRNLRVVYLWVPDAQNPQKHPDTVDICKWLKDSKMIVSQALTGNDYSRLSYKAYRSVGAKKYGFWEGMPYRRVGVGHPGEFKNRFFNHVRV